MLTDFFPSSRGCCAARSILYLARRGVFTASDLRFMIVRKLKTNTEPTTRTTKLVIVSEPGDENGSALSACQVTIPTNPK